MIITFRGQDIDLDSDDNLELDEIVYVVEGNCSKWGNTQYLKYNKIKKTISAFMADGKIIDCSDDIRRIEQMIKDGIWKIVSKEYIDQKFNH